MINKCPYCNKKDCIPEVAFNSTKMYGNESHYVKCVHCKKIMFVGMSRVVKLDSIEKTDVKEADWS